MSIIEPPRVILERIETMFANFLWNDNHDGTKHHWISWKSLSRPTVEGGIGVLHLKDIDKALKWKLCWLLQSSSTLWSRFILSKYCDNLTFSAAVHKQGVQNSVKGCFLLGMNLRNILILLYEAVHLYLYSFWRTGVVLELLSTLLIRKTVNSKWIKVFEVFSAGLEFRNLVCEILPPNVLHIILEHMWSMPLDGNDLIAWKPDVKGVFSTKSAYNCIRESRTVVPTAIYQSIWQSPTPLKCAFLMLRAIINRLPLDYNIKIWVYH